MVADSAENDARCSCGNRFDGDNLCMVSACQWEGLEDQRPTAENDALTEWGVRFPSGAVQSYGSDETEARRFAITTTALRPDLPTLVVRQVVTPWEVPHDCEACADCIHDGHKCCGCYDGACCQPRPIPPVSCGCPVSGFGYRHHRHPCSRAGENEYVIPPEVTHD